MRQFWCFRDGEMIASIYAERFEETRYPNMTTPSTMVTFYDAEHVTAIATMWNVVTKRSPYLPVHRKN